MKGNVIHMRCPSWALKGYNNSKIQYIWRIKIIFEIPTIISIFIRNTTLVNILIKLMIRESTPYIGMGGRLISTEKGIFHRRALQKCMWNCIFLVLTKFLTVHDLSWWREKGPGSEWGLKERILSPPASNSTSCLLESFCNVR